jgi:hypothetical protein
LGETNLALNGKNGVDWTPAASAASLELPPQDFRGPVAFAEVAAATTFNSSNSK